MIVKVFSGALSDWTRRRKPLVLAGYGLGALSKLAFPLATTLGWVVGARVVDRIGKGIRGAPRDALIADLTPRGGARRGVRTAPGARHRRARSPDRCSRWARWRAFAGDFRAAFWVAVIPAALCVLLIVLGVREPADDARGRGPAAPLAHADEAAGRALRRRHRASPRC